MLIRLSTARFLASEALRPRILVVDDETMICDLLGFVLEEDYKVVCAGTSDEALRVLDEQSIDVMLLDYRLPLGGAVDVAKRADDIGIAMVWMTGDPAAIKTSPHAVLLKPFHIARLLQALTEARNSARLLTKPIDRLGRKPCSDAAGGGSSVAFEGD